MGIDVNFTIINQTADNIQPEVITQFEGFLKEKNGVIKNKQNLTENDRVIDYLVELSHPDYSHLNALKNELYEQIFVNVDIALQKSENRNVRQLFVFDMDSTLIQQEVIEMIAAYADVEPEVEKITTAAMEGKIDFTESLKQRVGLLKGIKGDVFEDLKEKISFTPGARELTKSLKERGIKLAVLSGGFIPLAEYVKEQLGLDYAYANQLEIDSSTFTLTGKTQGMIVNGETKAELLKQIAQKEGIDLNNCVAVGDGSNDLPMMRTAGYGIAFNAKPIVQQQAPAKLNSGNLRDVLYILGVSDL